MTILECHHFRLPVRRFIIDLFDKTVMRRIVLDEEESEGDTEMGDDRTFVAGSLPRAPGAF
jgi:rapamycin-insensitive companion of mTOR